MGNRGTVKNISRAVYKGIRASECTLYHAIFHNLQKLAGSTTTIWRGMLWAWYPGAPLLTTGMLLCQKESS